MEKYCSSCGELLRMKYLETEGRNIPYCECCKKFVFPSFNTAVSMIVRDKDTKDILLIKQYGNDFYILVAGYTNQGENLEHTCIRELKEETGMDAMALSYNRSEYFMKSNTLMCNFTVWVNKNTIHTNSEIDSFAWFSKEEAVSNIKKGSLAEQFLVSYLKEE